MSYYEALDNGIPMEEQRNGMTAYYPPCHYCGAPVKSFTYNPSFQYACAACRKEAVAQKRAEQAVGEHSTKEKRLDSAIRRISKVADIKQYEKGIHYVQEHLDTPYWFDSAEEIMVALELIRRGIKTYHQVKIFEYRVDFLLPDLKVVLEVDGRIYHGRDRKCHQQIRDDVICWKLGKGWQVIRIDTENINQNVTRLMKGIYGILAHRKRKKCSAEFRKRPLRARNNFSTIYLKQ